MIQVDNGAEPSQCICQHDMVWDGAAKKCLDCKNDETMYRANDECVCHEGYDFDGEACVLQGGTDNSDEKEDDNGECQEPFTEKGTDGQCHCVATHVFDEATQACVEQDSGECSDPNSHYVDTLGKCECIANYHYDDVLMHCVESNTGGECPEPFTEPTSDGGC